jgi:putative transposase
MNNINQLLNYRKSLRLRDYDYAQAGLYFVTICCNKRACLFGEIVTSNGSPKMEYNEAGIMANKFWLEIPSHFPNVRLHEFIIMPNHVHGIIELLNNDHFHEVGNDRVIFEYDEERSGKYPSLVENHSARVENHSARVENFQPLRFGTDIHRKHEYQHVIPRSIGSIVRGYKTGVTKWFRSQLIMKQVWQPNYYDRIIRNNKEYQNVSAYIINNPENWVDDAFYME